MLIKNYQIKNRVKNQFKPKYPMTLTKQQTPTKIPTVQKVGFGNPVMHGRITGSKYGRYDCLFWLGQLKFNPNSYS